VRAAEAPAGKAADITELAEERLQAVHDLIDAGTAMRKSCSDQGSLGISQG
jgi:hypothetical protein